MVSSVEKESTKRMRLDADSQKLAFLEVAKAYCNQHGLSFEKLRKQRFSLIYGEGYFGQPSEVKPNGLMNDLDTQPKTTLIIKNENGRLVVSETEHARKYLV
jgi:hypothetical protein